MNVQNNTNFLVIAICWHEKYGYGEELRVLPKKSGKLIGPPYTGESGGWTITPNLDTETITCHEAEDTDREYQVLSDNPCVIQHEKFIISIKHYRDEDNN